MPGQRLEQSDLSNDSSAASAPLRKVRLSTMCTTCVIVADPSPKSPNLVTEVEQHGLPPVQILGTRQAFQVTDAACAKSTARERFIQSSSSNGCVSGWRPSRGNHRRVERAPAPLVTRDRNRRPKTRRCGSLGPGPPRPGFRWPPLAPLHHRPPGPCQ